MRTVTIRPHAFAAGGDAIGRLGDGDESGKIVMATGALPGELVRVELRSDKRDVAFGTVVEVLDPSADRVGEPCSARQGGCGGCDWQHMTVDAQLRWKVDVVGDALRRLGRIGAPAVWPGGAVSPWAYRTSVRVTAAGDGRLGFRAAGTHEAVVPGECLVVDPALVELLVAIRWHRGRRARAGRGGRPLPPEISLRVSRASGQRTVWTDSGRLEGVPDGVGVGPGASVTEVVAGRELRVSAGSFFQSGPEAAALLVRTVSAAAGGAAHRPGVIDAYGGVGLFSVGLALDGPHVVEGSRWACADARRNLASSAAVVHETAVEEWEPVAAPLVVADPSRHGLGAPAAARLAASGAPVFVLVSCDAAALGRDAALLRAHGYEHRGTAVLDVFPQTSHVEAVTRFERPGAADDLAAPAWSAPA